MRTTALVSQSPEGSAPDFHVKLLALVISALLMSQFPEGSAPDFHVIQWLASTHGAIMLSQSPERSAPDFHRTAPRAVADAA